MPIAHYNTATEGKEPPEAIAKTLAIEGEAGRYWYENARTDIKTVCDRCQWDRDEFTDILAITSPRVHVKRNIRMTIRLFVGLPCHDIMRSTRSALAHYCATGLIRGSKTGPFADCLKGNDNAIVLDTWMAYAFDVNPLKIGTKRIANPIKDAIRATSHKLSWKPCQVQAAIWHAIIVKFGKTPAALDVSGIEQEFMPF